MTTTGLSNTNLGMEPYTAIEETIDVVFVEENDNYMALVDDNLNYIEESIPIDHASPTIGSYNKVLRIETPSPYKIEDGDYATQFYFGAISVVGLFILFRMMQKSRA
jgi:hypothetical protein